MCEGVTGEARIERRGVSNGELAAILRRDPPAYGTQPATGLAAHGSGRSLGLTGK